MFWGLSSALDLQEEYFKLRSCELQEFNILTIGGCDMRHILKTMAQAYRHRKIKINFYIIEGCPELIARQLLLLSIALESPLRLGLLEKTRFFMEIYGNSLLRTVASKYLIEKARHFVKMITNLEYMSKIMPIVSVEKVKYKERDYIENLLMFWQSANTNLFNICDLWDKRLRSALGVRYDCRDGVFDWDFNMRLKDVGGKIVASQEYKHFRSSGVAFTWLETEVSRPNCSLAAGVESSGERYLHRGYLGDIVTGPYAAYGLNCEEKQMMESNHGMYKKRSTDISERNIMRMLHELQTGEPFDPKTVDGITDHNLGSVTIAELDAKLSEEMSFSSVKNVTPRNFPCIDIEFATIAFHSYSNLEIYCEKADFQRKFNIMYISHNLFPRINSSVANMLDDNGIILIEGRKFILDLKKENITAFEKQIKESIVSWKCCLMQPFEPLKDEFAKVIKLSTNT